MSDCMYVVYSLWKCSRYLKSRFAYRIRIYVEICEQSIWDTDLEELNRPNICRLLLYIDNIRVENQ